MVQVKANESILSVIGTLKVEGRAEVLDDRGAVIAYLIPAERDEDELYRKAALLFDPEEVRRRKEDHSPGYTTAEVLERLRSMDNS